MTARIPAALCGGAILALAFAAPMAQAAPDYSTAAQPAPVAKIEAAQGASVTRSDKALDALIAPGAKIEKLASGFVFTEGPTWHKGEMWFSDLRGNKVYSITPAGKLTMRLDHAGGVESFDSRFFRGPNAMVTDKDGDLLLEQHSAHRIVKLDDKMRATSFIDKYQGKALNSPNDMVFAADGALWFTDPPFFYVDPNNDKIDANKQPGKVQKTNNVYRYKDGKLTAPITDLPNPNGIGFSPDGKTLYISNTAPKAQLYKYDVQPNGTVTNKKLMFDWTADKGAGVPDGLKVDSQGNLWATGEGGIRIISPAGKILGQIVLPEVAANLTFGGNDMKTLYIAGSTGVYRLPLLVAGERPMYTK
jgi:gluconolactonase